MEKTRKHRLDVAWAWTPNLPSTSGSHQHGLNDSRSFIPAAQTAFPPLLKRLCPFNQRGNGEPEESPSTAAAPEQVNGQENSDQAPNITSRGNTCSQVIRPANESSRANVTETLNRADSICCGENAAKHDQEAPRWRRSATMEHAPHPVSVLTHLAGGGRRDAFGSL